MHTGMLGDGTNSPLSTSYLALKIIGGELFMVSYWSHASGTDITSSFLILFRW